MVKTVREFTDELKTLRREMRKKGAKADTKLVASWVDRLVISLEEFAPTLGLMGEGLSQLAESEECVCKPAKKKGKKKTVKKKAKKKAKKKRRR